MNKILLALFLCFSLCWSESIKSSDKGLKTPEMIKNHNYPVETHYVQTEDGYILQVHRIPHGIKSKTIAKKGSIFLMHGLVSSSADWVNMGPERSLGYILADLGYDVWIGNARGNGYSRNHTTLDPDNGSEFWDFSWHEIGYYDLPAMIDYMLKETGDEGFYYMGHSQGATSLLVLLSTKPEYNAKIKLAQTMGTAAFMNHTSSTNKKLASVLDELMALFNALDIYEAPLKFISDFGMQKCDDPSYQSICISIINKFGAGEDTPQIDLALMSTIFTNVPSSASMKQSYHYMQLVRSGRFQQYDFGKEKNLEIYGSETPPEYDLSLITAPLAIYSALNDGTANHRDSTVVAEKVSNLVENYIVPHESFNHIDYIFAKDVVKLFYNKLLSDLAKF